MVIVVMGAAGAGKTTVGQGLAVALGWRFVDGDEYHPASNVAKMHAGWALTDEDRAPWLSALAGAIERVLDRRENLIVACSALKERYRTGLLAGRRHVRFLYLKADEALLADRLERRGPHFLDPALLGSQLAALEEPRDELTITVDAALAPELILDTVRRSFGV
jgi:gluconokinase